MKAVTVHDAKTNLSKYIAQAKTGKPVYIGGFGKAEVMLVQVPAAPRKRRDFSLAKGKIRASDTAFADATDAEVAALLYED